MAGSATRLIVTTTKNNSKKSAATYRKQLLIVLQSKQAPENFYGEIGLAKHFNFNALSIFISTQSDTWFENLINQQKNNQHNINLLRIH
jgi:hypothetical protein